METVVKIAKSKKAPHKSGQFANLEEAVQYKQSEIKKIFRDIDLKAISKK
ncbi:hypothetical protein [Runella sp.]